MEFDLSSDLYLKKDEQGPEPAWTDNSRRPPRSCQKTRRQPHLLSSSAQEKFFRRFSQKLENRQHRCSESSPETRNWRKSSKIYPGTVGSFIPEFRFNRALNTITGINIAHLKDLSFPSTISIPFVHRWEEFAAANLRRKERETKKHLELLFAVLKVRTQGYHFC